ncbi:MAG: tRNA pseudouridine(38-40) synthase TruA [Bacteroidaceae bacterium]|nr:tRNA pseudouridine(38-40) synthase TruA [Bacteroidaceae bacterium]
MARYFITLQYDGTNYHGWQIQPNGITVEECVEKSLSTLLGRDIDIVGAGRTDAGVHARKMVAHFDFEGTVDCDQMVYKLNRMLPRDIAILCVEPVSDEMHARFSAKSRTYHYYIHTRKDAFLRQYSCLITFPLDLEKMNEGADVLKEYKDFGAFCKSHTDVKTTLCDVYEARFTQLSPHAYEFTISANRFLRNMVRAVVGTLVDVGRGKISIEGLRKIIEGKSRCDAGESMPANALFLDDVKY